MSTAALRELRRVFPDDHITLHTRALTEGLFLDADFIDEIVSFETSRWKVKDIYDNSQFLRSDEYDLAILFPNSFEAALTSALSRAKRRIGYNKDLRGLLLTDPIAVPEWKNRRHEVFYYLHLIAEVEKRILGRQTFSDVDPDITLNVSSERIDRSRVLLKSHGVDLTRKTVALGIGSTNSRAKIWPAEYFAKLNDELQKKSRVNVILIGSKGDLEAASRVYAACDVKPINIVGTTDIASASAVLAGLDLLVSNDMGLAHIAPAVGTRTLVLFGPTKDQTTRPFSPLATVLRHDVDCSPCMLRDCPIDHRCMKRLDPELVLRYVIKELDASN